MAREFAEALQDAMNGPQTVCTRCMWSFGTGQDNYTPVITRDCRGGKGCGIDAPERDPNSPVEIGDGHVTVGGS